MLKVTIDEGALDTVMVYVSVVDPFCAVTTTEITLVPTFRFIGADALPDATAVPLTVMLAVASVTVGVTVILVVVFPTLAA